MSATKKPANTAPASTPFTSTAAFACTIGADCAQEWRDHVPGDHITATSATAWRAICYAEAVHEYEYRDDFLQLLASWEQGFDSTLIRANLHAASGTGAGSCISQHIPAPEAEHQLFSHLHGDAKNDSGTRLAARTLDVCNGIETCLELVHSSDLTRRYNLDADPGEEVAPTLSINDTDRLLRLAIASVKMLANAAEGQIDQANKRAIMESK